MNTSYLAPISHYATMLRNGAVVLEQWEHYTKQTYRNRCVIAGPNGRQVLTIPVEHNGGKKILMKDLRISNHGNWRHLHWNALVSSYGKSPFFEFYADDFRPFYEQHWEFLIDYNEALLHKTLELLDIAEIKVSRTEAWEAPHTHNDPELTSSSPSFLSQTHHLEASHPAVPYYQVFQSRHGFLPDLSIVDLLFNMGNEAILILTQQQ